MLGGLEAQRFWQSLGHSWGTLGRSWDLPGPPCGTFGALLGGLGVFLGLPDRHNENTCWLIDFYDDFVLVLGGSWGLLGASWAVLGASWCLLGASWRPLGELLCAFVIQERVQDARCCIIYHVQKKCLFLEREHEIQQP